MRTAIFIFVITILVSCQPKSSNLNLSEFEKSVQLEYAKGFLIEQYADYKKVEIINPWQKNTVLAKYYLVTDDSIEVPADGLKIQIPIKTLAASSATHYGFLEELQALDELKAVCTPNLIYNPKVRKLLENGKLVDLGDAFNIDTERSIALNPDLVMISGYKQDDPYAKRLINAGIPVVLNNEWMEESLLARAEWIKFVAVFVGKEAIADSVFNSVKTEYNRLTELASDLQVKPLILTGSNFRGTWYLPGGKSYMAKLYKDAGATYYFIEDTTAGSIPLQIEDVIARFAKADVWLNCNFASIKELVSSDPKHNFFNPVKSGEVYNFNKRMLPSTANDFWESSVVHPELLLKDVVKILHPELLPDYELFYSNKLE